MSFNEPKKRQQGFALPTPTTSSAHTSQKNGHVDHNKASGGSSNHASVNHSSSYIDTGLLMDDDSVWGSLSRPPNSHTVISASEPGPFNKISHGMDGQQSGQDNDKDMEDVIMNGGDGTTRQGTDGHDAPFSLDAFHNLNAWVSFSPLPTSSEPGAAGDAASDANKTVNDGFFLPGMIGTPDTNTGDDTRKPSLGASSPLTTGSVSTGPPSTGDGASVASDFTQATSVHPSSPVFPTSKPDMKKVSNSSLRVTARDGKPRPRSATTTATPTESISAVLESSRTGRPAEDRPSGAKRNPSSSGIRQGEKRRSPSNDRSSAAGSSTAVSRTADEGGVGKAPRSRSRPTRRNSTGPAARLGSKASPPQGQPDALRIDTSTETTGGAADRSSSFGGIPIPWTASPWPAGYQWPHFAAPGSHPHGAPTHGWSQWPQGYPQAGTPWAAPGHPSMPMPFPYPGPQGWPFPAPGVGTTPGGEPLGSPGFHPQSLPSSMPAMFGNMNLQVSAQSPTTARPSWFPEPSGAVAPASGEGNVSGSNGAPAQREGSSERGGPAASMSPPTKKEDSDTPSLAEMRTSGDNSQAAANGSESKRSPPRTWPENKVRRASRSLGRVSGRILEDVPETEAVHAMSHDSPFASSNSDASPSTNALSSMAASSRLKKVVDGKNKDDASEQQQASQPQSNGTSALSDSKDATADDEEMETLGGDDGEDASDVDEDEDSSGPSSATAAAKKKASTSPATTTNPTTGRRVKSESEKRKKRRESHNLVERRRRDTINERIAELASLLPESMLLDAIAHSQSGGNNSKVVKVPMPEGCLAKLAHGKCSVEEAALDALASAPANSETLAAAQARPNKGIILRKSVDYIRALQDFIEQQASHNRMLQAELMRHQEQGHQHQHQQPNHAPSSGGTSQRLWPHETTDNFSWPLGNLASTFDLSELDMDAFRKMVAEHESATEQQQQQQQGQSAGNHEPNGDNRAAQPAPEGVNGKHGPAPHAEDEDQPNEGAFFTHLDMMHRASAKATDDSKLGVPSSSRTHSRSHSYAGPSAAMSGGPFGAVVPPPSLGDWLASAAGLAHNNNAAQQQHHDRSASMSMGMGLGGGLGMGMGMNTSVDMGPGMNSLGSLGSFCGGFNGAGGDPSAPAQGQQEHSQAREDNKQQQHQQQQQAADTLAAAAA